MSDLPQGLPSLARSKLLAAARGLRLRLQVGRRLGVGGLAGRGWPLPAGGSGGVNSVRLKGWACRPLWPPSRHPAGCASDRTGSSGLLIWAATFALGPWSQTPLPPSQLLAIGK